MFDVAKKIQEKFFIKAKLFKLFSEEIGFSLHVIQFELHLKNPNVSQAFFFLYSLALQ